MPIFFIMPPKFSKTDLIETAKETRSYFEGVLERFPDLKKNIDATVVITNAKDLKLPEVKENKTVVSVVNEDSIDCAYRLYCTGLNPLVLNMASSSHPGGGFETGATAQEEELFRRTTYELSLCKSDIKSQYPLKGASAIYSPGVVVFRDNRVNAYELYKWKDCCALNFVAMPGIRKPKLVQDTKTKEWELNKTDTELLCEKIRNIFRIAVYYGHDCVVLSALGCGAYDNPPKYVAKMFKKVMSEFPTVFKNITFAILSDKNDKYGNFAAFKSVM